MSSDSSYIGCEVCGLTDPEDETSNHTTMGIKAPPFFESPIIIYILTGL
jgi:hypothetical protein